MEAIEPMIGFPRATPMRSRGKTLLPLTLAVVVALLGAVVYLELVAALLEYAG